MNSYKGQVRRQMQPTPTKISLQSDKGNFQQAQQQKYSRNKDFQKSQLSYYQSEVSHTIYDNQTSPSQRQLKQTRSMNENKQLYDSLIPVRLQSSDREEYSTYLRIQIINTVQKGLNKLTLYLTDDRDPKFLWLFFIKENDFMILKKQQKLRVDYRGFPIMLTDHLDMCKSEKQISSNESCSFFLLFEMKKTEGSLSILEANRYKESVHLNLKCKIANDEQIKQYLSQKLMKIQTENVDLRNKISNLEQTLSIRKEQIAKIEIELKQQMKTNQRSSQQSSIQIDKIRAQLTREKLQNEQKLKKDHQKQFKSMKQRLEEELNKIDRAYNEYKQKYESTAEKLTTLESKQRQLTFDLSTKTKEIQTYVKRLEESKAYAFDLENKRTENQKTIIEQKVRIESLQSQIADKLRIIESNVELKSTNSHQISSLEMKSEEYKKQIEKMDAKIQALQNELQKSQAMVEDYRQKSEKRKEKNQQKNNIIKQQQRYINEKQNEIFDLKRQLQTNQKLLDEVRLDSEDKNRKINDLKRQIEECQKKIKQDNDLITHLQKQLNERTIGIRPGFGATSYQRSTSPFTSNVSGREYATTTLSIGNTTTSRLKFTSTGDNNNEEVSQKGSKKQVQIKRYVPTNEEAYRERSKSPIINSRLNQQKEPEQNKVSTSGIVKPVKFKFSQRQ